MAKKKGEPQPAEIPDAIPMIAFTKDGEPYLVKEVVVRPSPIPIIVVCIIFAMILGTLGQQLWFQHDQHKKDSQSRQALQKQVDKLDAAIAAAAADRANLRQLVIDVSQAKTQQQVAQALADFIKRQQKLGTGSSVTVVPSPVQGGSGGQSAPQPVPGRTTNPAPSASGGGNPGGSSGGGNPHPSPTPTPAPSPTPSPLVPVGPTVCRLTGIFCNPNSFSLIYRNGDWQIVQTTSS